MPADWLGVAEARNWADEPAPAHAALPAPATLSRHVEPAPGDGDREVPAPVTKPPATIPPTTRTMISTLSPTRSQGNGWGVDASGVAATGPTVIFREASETELKPDTAGAACQFCGAVAWRSRAASS